MITTMERIAAIGGRRPGGPAEESPTVRSEE
jgi:hypothetical protein